LDGITKESFPGILLRASAVFEMANAELSYNRIFGAEALLRFETENLRES